MGDRVVIQVISKDRKDFSPIAYGHWCGSRTPEILRALKTRMVGRSSDVEYTFARLIQEMTAGDDGNLSFGNAKHILTPSDSHGDAGCVLVICNNDGSGLTFETFGGYLKPSDFEAAHNDQLLEVNCDFYGQVAK